MEGLKQAVELLGRDADAFVLHRHHDPLGGGFDDRDQPQVPSFWHGPQSVGGEVPHDLLDLALVGLVPNLVGRHVNVDNVPLLHLRAVAQEQGRIVERPADVEPRDLKPLRTRVSQEGSNRRV